MLSRSELAPKMKELLNKNGITCTVGGTDFAEIFVSEDEYESSLRKAIEVLESNWVGYRFFMEFYPKIEKENMDGVCLTVLSISKNFYHFFRQL